MKKLKIAITILIVLIIVGGVSWFWLEKSQPEWFLIFKLKRLNIEPVDLYFAHSGEKCGIWYQNIYQSGANNNQADECFEQAYVNCTPQAILIVNHFAGQETYSFLRILGQQPGDNCLVQNYFYQKQGDNQEKSWINTCEILDSEKYLSCKPKYFD